MLNQQTVTWFNQLYEKIAAMKGNESYVYLRGQSVESWPLKPKIARPEFIKAKDGENNLFIDFKIRSELIFGDEDSWNLLFRMQHYGLPTRLLDWSEVLNVALFFAVSNKDNWNKDGAIYLLNPFSMNEIRLKMGRIVPVLPLLDPEQKFDYFKNVANAFTKTKSTTQYEGSRVMVAAPRKTNSRLSAQQGAFTLHEDLNVSLEELHAADLKLTNMKYLEKVTMPCSIKKDIYEILSLGGVNEFSIYPDIEGLVKQLLKEYSL